MSGRIHASLRGRAIMGAVSSLPGRHDGEMVVEPGITNGDDVDMTEAPTFRAKGSIEAVQMHTSFHVMTPQGRVTGAPGDWLARNPVTGERWWILDADFAIQFEPVEETP